jgi:hypothetical protein
MAAPIRFYLVAAVALFYLVAAVALFSLGLSGGARYHAAPLSLARPLQSNLSALQNREPDGQVVPLSGPPCKMSGRWQC